ncbi:DEKNAAC100689 [Brettanomyces naardenensis]|uniref:Cytidine deaminase n=1 Tax=Brettanomyces naardenensis TaxID=13370 RepID=A0A448YFF1_BRENA|nr:DEKNAAC100689 [Brettanomyces naardenensis]
MLPQTQPYTGKSPIVGVTDTEFQRLVSRAIEAKGLSYSPYSHFPVGCSILSTDGSYTLGANVENASYGGAICAERTAIVKAVTSGHSKFKALAVSTNSNTCSSPCGICRQVIREFSSPNLSLPIIMLDKDGSEFVLMTIGQLLPLSFGPDDLATS